MLVFSKNVLIYVSAFVLVLCSGFVSAQDQVVNINPSQASLAAGESINLDVSYTTSDESLTVGLGVRLHFDSTAISCDQSDAINS